MAGGPIGGALHELMGLPDCGVTAGQDVLRKLSSFSVREQPALQTYASPREVALIRNFLPGYLWETDFHLDWSCLLSNWGSCKWIPVY
jgi:hypothetical protein